ncbi:MAG: hypothetical protein M3P41_06535 [Actinomycetota bacterium]|nr:hypothetical protein [Actinomycetota bacterium]
MEFTEAARILSPDPLPLEMGIERLESGQLRVAVRTLMTGCTGAMFEWWFGWGPMTREYAWWHPHDHVSSDWLDLPGDGTGIGSTHVVGEKLGGDEVHALRIRFHDPAEIFGDELVAARSRGDVSAAVTANIGFGADPPRDDEGRPLGGRLVHIGRDTAFGLVLRSNFWLGWGLDEPNVPDETGLGLIKHSHAEWLYLARFLPALYIAERRDVEPAPAAW